MGKVNEETSIKRRVDIPTSRMDDELGMLNVEKGKYFTLDPIGTHIWNLIEDTKTIKEVIDRLMEEYEVDYDTCLTDVTEYVEKMIEADLVRIED